MPSRWLHHLVAGFDVYVVGVKEGDNVQVKPILRPEMFMYNSSVFALSL